MTLTHINHHLDGLRDQFKLLVDEIESLRKERDEYKSRLLDFNFVCEGCKKESSSSPSTFPSPSISPNQQHDSQEPKKLDLEITHVLSHTERIWCLKFSQDGKFLATGCRNGKTYIYDVQTGSLTRVLRNLLVEHDSIRAICFSRDAKYLATSSCDTYIYIWDIHTKHVRNAFKGHADLICSLDFSPNNNKLLVSASYDNTLRLWKNTRHDTCTVLTDKNHSCQNYHYDYYTSVKFSPDGTSVAASHYDGAVRIWDVRLGRLVRRVRAAADGDLVNDIAFMPDGKRLVSAGRDMTLKCWHVGTVQGDGDSYYGPPGHGRLGVDVDDDVVEEFTRLERQFSGHEDSVYSLSISPDGRWIASGSDDQSVRIWDAHTAKVECILQDCYNSIITHLNVEDSDDDGGGGGDGDDDNNDNGEVNSVDFDPETGRYLAAGGEDGTIRIWKLSHVPR